MSEILDVDLLAFEQGSAEQRRAVVDGVRRSLETGFVYTHHDVSVDLLDTTYGMLQEFFRPRRRTSSDTSSPVPTGRPATPGSWSRRRRRATPPTGRRCSIGRRRSHRSSLEAGVPTAYPDQVLPEATVPGITKVLYEFHDTIADLQRRFLRVIAEGIGCHETFFDDMVRDGPR